MAVGVQICSFLHLRCSVIVAGTEGRYLRSVLVGGGKGQFCLALAGDVGCGFWRLDGGGILIRRLLSVEFAICLFCVVVWIFVGVGVMVLDICRGESDVFGGVPSLASSLARDDLGCYGHYTRR